MKLRCDAWRKRRTHQTDARYMQSLSEWKKICSHRSKENDAATLKIFSIRFERITRHQLSRQINNKQTVEILMRNIFNENMNYARPKIGFFFVCSKPNAIVKNEQRRTKVFRAQRKQFSVGLSLVRSERSSVHISILAALLASVFNRDLENIDEFIYLILLSK